MFYVLYSEQTVKFRDQRKVRARSIVYPECEYATGFGVGHADQKMTLSLLEKPCHLDKI